LKEIQTHQIIKNSLQIEYPDGWYHKPTDVGMSGGEKSRFMIKRPFDILYYWKSNLLAIEAKLLKNGTSFSFEDVKKHQIENLIEVDKNGGYSYIAIHLWKEREINKILFIELHDFLYWKSTTEGRVKWEELQNDLRVMLNLDVKNGLINLRKSYLIGG